MFARRWRISYLSSRRLLSTTTTVPPPPPEATTGASQVDAFPGPREQVPYLMPQQGPRLLRVYDLPAGYNLSEVIKAAGGLVVNVTPGEHHVILEYYSWLQTVSHRKTITLHGEAYPVERTFDRYGVNTSVVARLGREQLARQLNIVFSSEQAPLTSEDIKSRAAAFGPLEDFQATMSPDGMSAVLKVSFLKSEHAHLCQQSSVTNPSLFPGARVASVMDRSLWTRVPGSPRAPQDASLASELVHRCVEINNFRKLIPPLDLVDLVNYYGSVPGKPKVQWQGETVISFRPSGAKMSMYFVDHWAAKLFYEAFRSMFKDHEDIKVTPFLPPAFTMKTAIDAGARRTLTVALKEPRSRKQLKDDFTIYGQVESSFIDGLQTAVLNYHNIHHALRIVEVLTSGAHDLGDQYSGCELSFLATNAIQQTEPAYIATGKLPRPQAPTPVSMPRAICITGLEKGYNVTDVVKKLGHGPVEMVEPHEDHLFIHYFSHYQAYMVHQHPAGMQVSTVTDKHDTPLAADIIARMAYRQTSRAVRVTLETLIANELTEENATSLFAVFGPLESLAKSITGAGKPCLTAVFLNHADALKCMDSPMKSLNLVFAEDPSMYELTPTSEPRRVVIENLPTHIPTPVIFDAIRYDAASRSPHTKFDVAYFNRPPDSATAIIDFYPAGEAARFCQVFQVRADLIGAQMRVEGIRNLDLFHQMAMRSGARRIVDLSLAAPLELNQLEDDLIIYGRMRVIFASTSRVLIAYDDIRSAVKAVSCLTTGKHAFGNSYDGTEVCFFDSYDGPSTGSAVVKAGTEREESEKPKVPWRPRELAGYGKVETISQQPGKGERR